MLAAELHDGSAHFAEVVPGQGWEEVVLDLVVEPACGSQASNGQR